jgi:hypothetical protein
MRKVAFALIVLGLSAGVCGAAFAQVQNIETNWKNADQCAKDALSKFPDYTPEANAKREEFRRACLRSHSLPAPDTPIPQQNAGSGQ